ncbi:MAG TPA: condensation domain-containing protein, partial [Pyrinomonadaceae bacterium]|nr:condensation domain-containing protein [Pyrinomonadaceae bacterium]
MTAHQPIQGYKLSPQQAHLWLAQRGGQSPTFYAQCAVLLEGDVDARLLRAALADLVERHEILRTTFQSLPGMNLPLQVVGDGGDTWGHDEENVSWEPEGGRAEVIRLLEDLRRGPTDFERGPVLRTKLLVTPAGKHLLLLSVPSVCADARGLDNLVQDLARCYVARSRDEAAPEPPVQYPDASGILNDFLEAEEVKAGRDYWRRQQLSDLPLLRLPFEGRAAAGTKSGAGVVSREVAAETAAGIEECALAHGASVPAFLLACWQVLLGRLTMQTDIAVGVLAACRTYDEFQEAAGLFARHLPVRTRTDEDVPFVKLLAQVEAALDEAGQWQDYFSWEQVAGAHVRDGAQGPLPFGFEVEDGADEFRAGSLTLSVIERRASVGRFKINLACRFGAGLRVQLHFDANSYRAEDVERLGGQYETLLKSALANVGQPIGELEITGDAERQQLIEQFNATGEEYPPVCLHEPFERRAALTPDRVAVSCGPLQLTYSELDSRADSLASELRRRGVGPDAVVGLLCERSAELVVGLLAILKSGGAYLPLEPSLPEGRLRLMCEGAGARLAVVATDDDARLAASLGMDSVPAHSLPQSTSAPEGWRPARPSNLAYVIYTSGSTGTPKGVMVAHSSICNRLEWMRRRFPPA